MASKLDLQDDAISEINVVPLVDIILVVLIIFMVTAPMIMKPSISVNLPKAASGDSTQPSKLSISLSKDGQIVLNGAIATDEELKAKAESEIATNAEVQAVISADRDLAHGRVVQVLDIVKMAGVKKFAISIEKVNR